ICCHNHPYNVAIQSHLSAHTPIFYSSTAVFGLIQNSHPGGNGAQRNSGQVERLGRKKAKKAHVLSFDLGYNYIEPISFGTEVLH
ncbi:MAG: hypothetical protein L0Y62_03330, partial [Nitrospirae bacterium]|nr:hypothetical protein [Nitrospirota bacterium]